MSKAVTPLLRHRLAYTRGFVSLDLSVTVKAAFHLQTIDYTSYHSLFCLINRKVTSVKQTVFLSEQCFAISKVTTNVQSAIFLDTGTQSFCLVCSLVDDMTLFEGSPEIRCSGVSSRYCCYGNNAAGSKPV